MANNIIKGRKGGDSKPRTPTEQPNDLQSAAKAKILIALGEGEFAGGLTGKNIYRDGTPLENADGSQNFSGVYWEFRPGTQAQTYIQGIPGTENEISVGTEVSSKTAWTHTFTNTQLSAVRVRLKWPSLMKQEDDGDVVGNTVEYAIDLQTDGGAWQTVLETAVTGKATSGYERSHRIDLPQAGSTWTLRLRKITPDANSVKVGDVMTLQSYTEVIDAKLRYPNTALLYIEFDASQLNGSIPQISCEPRGRVIRVPDNYNPETREYTGVWTGGFKWAWTDNPAWIYYDIVTADRFGLGNRLSSANISKWTLYQIAQYCDQLVPDGRGGDGMEPRYTCNVYVQERNDAYTVLRDFAAIFRGMTCWNGEQIVVQADMPRDVDFTYTRANIVGKPRYSSSSSQVRYTNALISWSDPDNAYADAMEPAFIPELVSRYSFNQLEMTAIGCTRQSEAHRKGLWGILTNNKDRVVEFDVGLDGRIPQPGYIIALADELLAGRVNGGRISAVNGRVITLDRDVDAKPGDRLQLNLPSGISQSRTIQAVNGRRQITVTTAYSETPERECVWAIESDDLFLQQYRVTGVKENSDATLTITGVAHDPDKFARIDTGAIIDQRPVSVLPAGNQSPPDDIVITSRSVVNQGISVETMQVNWSAVSGAIAYEAQWRRNDGNWINVPRSSTTSFEVSGIYAGRYLVRVRAINAAEISSGWAYSEEKTLTGKVGEPLAPLALATRSLVHGVQVSWEFPTGSGDTLRTELQYSKNQDGSAPMPLSDVAYPGKSYQQMGLSMGAEFWYRARLVDRLGNESPWTGWVQGMASDNFDDYYENLTDAIKDTAAWEETQRTISETQEGIRNTQQELEQTAEALRKEAEDQAKQVSQNIDASAKSITADVDGKISAVNKTITDEITLVNETLDADIATVNQALDSGLAQANKGVQEAKSAVADANKQIATVNKSLTDSITQVRQSVTDTAAEINATIDLEIARVSKTLADGDAALNAQIKTAENGLKQSLSQVNTTLTSAVKQETADRIADVNAKAAQAADELLAATQGIEASIESLTQVMKTADENLAREMSSLAAGANIQFDSQVIWHFNNQTTEGWTGSAGVPGVSQDGWLRPADSATDPYITSPGGLAVDGAAYRFIMLRFRKTGKPVWAGEIRWVSAGENFNNTKRYIVAEPEYADGVATLTVRDIPWTGNIDRIRLDLTNQQDASNFIEFDWIAVGRPAPGASTAALQDVRSTLSNALTAEAQARSTLAAQMRGSYEGSDLEKVTSGLLYQEKTARVTAISAEVKARESLQTQFNDNKAAVSGELSSLTTEQSAQASRIGGLETSLGKKADAAALTSLTQKVEQQGATLTSQGAALTSLTNRVGQTETGLAGTNEALSGLQSVVTRQGDRITSQGQSITKLTSDLGTTNAALAKKAEATAVTALTQQVEQNGRDIRSNTDSITSLSNQLVNGQPNRWSRRLYPVQLANAGTVPSFSDIRAVAPTVVDEVADAAKLDFTSAGSYLIALYSCQVKVAADTTITLAPGARVFDDTGAIFVNGVQVAWGNASWNTVSFELKAGWNTVEFLVNQWTGQAYINLGLKLSDKVAEMYSGLGVSALANAAGVLSSNVSQIGNDVVSNSQNITQLRNALTQTDANVASKADQTAMNSLTGRVEKTESGLTAANANITSLKSAVRAGNASGGDLIPNPTFDPAYDQMGFSVVATTAEEVPPGCPYGYAARIASRDHHPNFAAFPATLNDVIEISALVACGAGTANFNLYVGTAVRPDTSTGAPLMAGGGKSPSATWQRTTWRFKVTQAMVDRGYIRPFLQISQNSPYGTVWFVTDWHMRNVTAAQKVQDTADATAAAVDSLTTTVTQQGNLLTSTGNRTTQLENGLATTNAAVAKKADATAVQDLTNTVTQLGNDLTAANSAITKLTGNLANTDKALAQKADATALATLDTKVTQQGKTLESQSNSLTNLSNSLSQVAADIDASGQIPGNLVVNPSFERGLDGYTGRSTATSVVEVSAPHSGTRALKVDPGSVSPGQYIPFVQGRTYEIGVWVKEPGATTDNGAGNNKLRIGNSAGQPVFERPYNSGTVGTNWTLISGRWKATETASLPVTLSNYLISGSRYFDDFYVTDVTDRVDIDATAGAVTGLTSRVSTAEGAITSQSQQLTNLQNSLNTTNSNVAKKADATALQSLQNTVEQHGRDLTTQSGALTSLQNSLNTTNSNVAKKADATALQSLQNTVEQHGKDLTTQSGALTSLQNSLNTTNSNVAKKADATALQSLQNTVEQHGRDLTTQSSALTNLENNFSSLAVGGTNLIRNADTLEGWSSRHATETYLGDRVAYTRLAKGASGYTQLDEQTLDVTGRTEFVFSFYAKGAYDGQEMASYFYNPSNTTTTETSQGVKGGAGDGKAVTKLTTAWARYWVKWVIPATSGTKRLIAARLESATSAEKEVWLCRPQLETGTVMTDWSPSPDDAASGITANTSAINSLTSRVTNAEGQLTAQSQSITNLQNSLNTTNNNVAQKASAQSVSDLTSRVTSAEGKITSQGQAITKLQGDLSSTTDKVNTKADQTALNALTGRVEKTEAGLTAANSNIVSLTAAVNAGNAAGDDYIPNPSFDPAYDRMGYDVVETTAAGVPADCPFRYAVRLAGRDHVPKINNIAVTPGDVYEMSALVACGTGSADFNFYIGRATTATGGIGARASGGNTRTTTAWKRATWRFTVPADTNFLRPFLQVNQSSPFGTVWYAADWHMRNVTAANSAQKTADATAKAVDSLTTTVSQQGDTLSSIGTRTTSLENSLRSTNDTVSKKADTTAVTQLQGTVTQQGNDIAAANSALTKLSSDLATTNANVNKKADASAMNTLQNQVTEQGKTLSAQGDSLTQLSNSLSQTAADIDASGKMPGNLIVNGSFERGAAGFTGWSSTATVADLQVPHSGNKALKMSAGQSNLVGQEIRITQGRTYRMGVWAKQDPGTTIKDAGNTKFRVADSTGLLVGSNYGPFSSGWQLVTFDWKATKTTTASFQLTTFLSAGAMYFDDFHVLDVTDEKDIAANAGAISQMNTRVTAAEGAITTQAQQLTKLSGDLAVTNAAVSKKAEQSAVTGLTTRMTSAEGKLDSQSQQLTSLQNSLTTMNTELGKKADTSAVSSLTGRVSQVENTITSQSQSITSLTSTINTIRTQGANPWVDGTFESYSDGQVLGGSGTAVVVASQKFTGDKSLKLRRDENNGGNSDKQLGTWQSVREDAKFRFEFWAMMPADQAPSSGWTTLVGIQSQNAAGQNAWQAAVTISEASLGARDKWVKFTGIASNNGAGRTRAVVWISTRGATGNGTPGYSLYIDDLVITDVTDAKAAQDASDATASAVSGLTARVTDAEGKITAQAQQQTALASKVDNANSRVDNMAKTLSDSQSTQASLNTSLQSQIDAQAAANIKNQTTLDNAIKSVASITSTQHTHATALEALATQQTTLTSSVGDLSASVQNTAKTVADVNGTVSSLWSMKVETVNGKNVGAGITLGSNGETSDMILYADRFSLFNRNNATAVPVMIAEGNELYIDTARIKNSSLTSTKIADGSITNAKIGNEIRSNDFVDGSRGWRIAKDGSSQFNNVIVRGAVYATDGWFQGTVYANHIEGDIGSFAINIAQHRTRKVPKATWQWFELARFRRQNFDQVINIRGGLLQTDSITIDGGAKLRAGMSYAPGDDGGLNPGYLSYAMLLRGTGATSGGGSMELGIELMYETGGATRLLTAQESMNVDNMSFVVPAGTGDAVLRYGCYLDRNGQMVLTILSRFDAFAARNNNVIRGSST
ncbi:host specificity protein J [Klebsiella phage vB_KpnS_KpLi5]|nr:host specificity protein J [Klebsiella phage vB_KpnS_KpLi5]